MEGFNQKINHQKEKWLPNKNAIKSNLEILHKGLALYTSKYENFIVLGDFHVGMVTNDISVSCGTYDLKFLLTHFMTLSSFDTS